MSRSDEAELQASLACIVTLCALECKVLCMKDVALEWKLNVSTCHCIASVYWSVRCMHWKEKMAMHNIHALECTHNYIASYLIMICMKGVALEWKPWALKVSTCL